MATNPSGAPVLMQPVTHDPLNMAAYATMNVGQPEDLYQPQWDKANYPAAGVASVNFFTVQVGASATLLPGTGLAAASRVKVLADTSLQQPGVIPTKDVLVLGISLDFLPQQNAPTGANTPSIPSDIELMRNASSLNVGMIDKPYLQLPVRLIPSAGGSGGGVAATTANATSLVFGFGSGLGSAAAIFWLYDVPLLIRAYQTFTSPMIFTGPPAPSQAYDLLLVFWAYTRRPSQ